MFDLSSYSWTRNIDLQSVFAANKCFLAKPKFKLFAFQGEIVQNYVVMFNRPEKHDLR
jgi:hypothetical protein